MTGTGHTGGDYGEDEYDDELTTSVASTSLPSTLHRRSSAPEMDEKLIESTSASISVVSSDVSSMKTNYPAPALVKPPLPEKPRGGGLGSKSCAERMRRLIPQIIGRIGRIGRNGRHGGGGGSSSNRVRSNTGRTGSGTFTRRK